MDDRHALILADAIADLTGGVASLAGYLAVVLIREKVADRETVIADLERMRDNTSNDLFELVADLVKRTRPWEIIEGGGDDPT